MIKPHSNQKGFTIMEAVVSTALFAFVVSSSLAVYMAVIRLDQKTRAERAVQQNARFIMEYFSKEIRNGSIDYTLANNSTTIHFTNQLDEDLAIQWSGGGLLLTKSIGGTLIGSTNLNSSDVIVTQFKFVIKPAVDPFILANNTNIQPHVTVIMELQSINQKFSELSKMNVQSTFSLRDYRSRQ